MATPVRVPQRFVKYQELLVSSGEEKAITAADIIEAMPDELLSGCGSPLPNEKPWGALNNVFTLGTNMVVHVEAMTSVPAREDIMMVDRLDWLIKGLRQEPGIAERVAAIVMERKLVEILLKRSPPAADETFSLLEKCVRDELPGTSACLLDLLCEDQYKLGTSRERELFHDTHVFLRRIAFWPRDYSAISTDFQTICGRLQCFTDCAWARFIFSCFDDFLKWDIELHQEKELIEKKISESKSRLGGAPGHRIGETLSAAGPAAAPNPTRSVSPPKPGTRRSASLTTPSAPTTRKFMWGNGPPLLFLRCCIRITFRTKHQSGHW
jgi:hypothetical protein